MTPNNQDDLKNKNTNDEDYLKNKDNLKNVHNLKKWRGRKMGTSSVMKKVLKM